MTKFRIASLLALSGALLLFGCGKKPLTKSLVKIDIDNNCVATPDKADVPDGGTVFWRPPATVTYKIAFSGDHPIPPPVTSGPTYTVHGGFLCSTVRLGCEYKYTLTKQGASSACADPGIRIIP
ncbi:MAG: hypothetical protein ACHP7J_02275 [Terriglobales bacterium]